MTTVPSSTMTCSRPECQALYLKAIHDGKTKTDTLDAENLVRLLRGGTFAFVCPKAMRASRDLLRRRNYLVRKRAELLAHLQRRVVRHSHQPEYPSF